MEVIAVTVRQLNLYVKSLLDSDTRLAAVTVCGEISNFKSHYASGHAYFALKDDTATVRCVMFKSSFSRLRFAPEDGQQVLCSGRISLYEKDGQYQFYVENMMPFGEGALAADFAQIRQRLENDGLLDPARKRRLPRFPKCIAVLTSSSGAAIHDITTVLGRRYPLCEVLTVPVNVQGERAVPDMISALNKIYGISGVDVLIIGRGGGSAYDLWAFNDERLARVLAQSPVPVISAVGHESDYSICDLVADVRAATPSVAAELAVPDIAELSEQLLYLKRMMLHCLNVRLSECNTKLLHIINSNALAKPLVNIVDDRTLETAALREKLFSAFEKFIEHRQRRTGELMIRLDSLSPLKVLSRGYAIAQNGGGVIRSADDVSVNDRILVRLNKGTLRCSVVAKEE